MPFDPSNPVNGTVVDADFLRAQLNALNDSNNENAATIAAQDARIAALEAAMAAVQTQLPNYLTEADVEPIAANNVDSVLELTLTLNDPPTVGDVQEILDKLNATIVGLHR